MPETIELITKGGPQVKLFVLGGDPEALGKPCQGGGKKKHFVTHCERGKPIGIHKKCRGGGEGILLPRKEKVIGRKREEGGDGRRFRNSEMHDRGKAFSLRAFSEEKEALTTLGSILERSRRRVGFCLSQGGMSKNGGRSLPRGIEWGTSAWSGEERALSAIYYEKGIRVWGESPLAGECRGGGRGKRIRLSYFGGRSARKGQKV